MTSDPDPMSRFGDGCDWCYAEPRPVIVDGITLARVDHDDCVTVQPRQPHRREGRR